MDKKKKKIPVTIEKNNLIKLDMTEKDFKIF
jgi:hypothetical protein